MKPIPVDLKLNVNARSELPLRSGDFVLVQVLKRLTGNKWAVGIKGRVFPATSEVPLTPGRRLQAQVLIQNGRINLKIENLPPNMIQNLIIRQGLQADATMETVVRAFLGSGLAVAPERLQRAYKLLGKLKLNPRKYARILAIVLEKGIDLSSRGLESLLFLLGYGEQDSGGRKGRGRRMPPDAGRLQQQLSEQIERPEESEGSALQVFNHLRGSGDRWVVIPFDYRYQSSGRVYGTIRLRYNSEERLDRLVVSARSDSGGKWSFVLDNLQDQSRKNTSRELQIFCDSVAKTREVRKQLDVLRIKLQNLGVKTDDTIREDASFDGFDLPWEEISYKSVDTVH